MMKTMLWRRSRACAAKAGIACLPFAAPLLSSTSALAQAALDPPAQTLPPIVIEQPAAARRPALRQTSRRQTGSVRRQSARAPGPATSGAAPAIAAGPAGASPSDLTVAAGKRVQELGKTDAAVSIVDGATLRDRQVQTTADLQKVLPGLKIDNRGSPLYANFTIRGINSFDFYNPSVQVLVDGVPQTSAALIRDISDVSRVEFLRGPQGTLFGINAFAGVISITTEKPRENRVTTSALASTKTFELGAATTAALIPETLFLDLGIKERHYLGQLTDIDRNWPNIDYSNALSGRAAVRYAPLGGDFDATLSGSHETLHSREENYVLSQDVNQRIYRSSLLGNYNVLDRELSTAALSWNYRFAGFTLSNITSFQTVDVGRRLFGSDFPERYSNVFEELRLSYSGPGPLKGVAGVTVSSGDFRRGQPGFPGFFGPSNNTINTDSLAAFGEATLGITDRLDLTGGVRIAYDRARINFRQPDIYNNGFVTNFANAASFVNAQPKVSLGYQIDETTRVYALVSEGYKPGGFNRTVQGTLDAIAYKPETAWNFEVGGRTALWGGRLALSGAVYHIRSQDQQIFVGPVGFQVLRNAGRGVSTGIELEAKLQATDRLLLSAQGSFGRSIFDRYTDPLTLTRYDGKRIPYAPDAIANLGARFLLDQDFAQARVTLTGNARFTSQTYFDIANTLKQGGYGLYDAGLEFAFPKDVTAKVFANNLTDKRFRTYGFTSGPYALYNLGPGREIGLDLRMRF